jgi:MFS transporter, PAT family, beta-lactamase induction signal transducer AmpG
MSDRGRLHLFCMSLSSLDTASSALADGSASPAQVTQPAGLLATRLGRYFTFFILYFSEGLPQGLTAVAMATWLRRSNIDTADIGVFVAAMYLPWGWKWTAGPLVDLVYPARIGRSRFWIVTAQVLMITTLLVLIGVDAAASMKLTIAIVIVHNIFAALQDVAIDALACKVLQPQERGTGNGLMFAGACLGNATGGAGLLMLSEHISMQATLAIVPLLLLSILLGVSLWLKEPQDADGPSSAAVRPALVETLFKYVREIFTSFFGSWKNVLVLIFGLLPAGAMALSLALQSNLAVELGMTDSQIGQLSLFSGLLSAAGCVVGGVLSDRFGRRLTISLYTISTVVPTIALGLYMSNVDWILPVADGQTRSASVTLLNVFWAACLSYGFIQGLTFGTRTALFMDYCNPAVAATQFTAYMSIQNLAIAYSAAWQGFAIKDWGYPMTLYVDAALGCAGLLALLLLKPSNAAPRAFQN